MSSITSSSNQDFKHFEDRVTNFCANHSHLDYLDLNFNKPIPRKTSFGVEFECFHEEDITKSFNTHNHSKDPNLLISDDLNLLKYNLQSLNNSYFTSTNLFIKRFREVREAQEHLGKQVSGLHIAINNLSKKVNQIGVTLQSHQPLTVIQVKQLVEEIAQQPKLIEAEAFKLTEDLNKKIAIVHNLLEEIQRSLVL